jgi:uncharacterized membrane protein YedE/YeeE
MAMIFPFESLTGANREIGLVVAVIAGMAFGFVLERAGFGRAPVLMGQFYLNRMTVLKVMFTAVIVAMLGMVVLSEIGLVDLKAVSDAATSNTYLWPFLVGGIGLGIGFVVSGYCPGTSVVAAASGNIDGMVAYAGVVLGSLLYSEAYPIVSKYQDISDLGQIYLYDLLKVPPAVVALLVAVMGISAFIGAEKLERFLARKAAGGVAPFADLWPRAPRRFAFLTVAVLSLVGLIGLVLPRTTAAVGRRPAESLSQAEMARRVLEEPWTLRILDLRPRAACEERRIPGAECVAKDSLANLGLADNPGVRDLVVVDEGELSELPAAVQNYPGRVLLPQGGFEGWVAYALTPPQPLPANARPDEIEAYGLQNAVHSAMTGIKQAPPPPAPAGFVPAPPKKKGGGGCSG